MCVHLCSGFSSVAFHLVGWERVSQNLEHVALARTAAQESQKFYFCFLSTVTGLTFVLLPVFYVGAGDPNSGPHVCMASALLTEPSPQFCGWLSSWAVEIKLKSLFFPVSILFETLSHWARRWASVIRQLEWQRKGFCFNRRLGCCGTGDWTQDLVCSSECSASGLCPPVWTSSSQDDFSLGCKTFSMWNSECWVEIPAFETHPP